MLTSCKSAGFRHRTQLLYWFYVLNKAPFTLCTTDAWYAFCTRAFLEKQQITLAGVHCNGSAQCCIVWTVLKQERRYLNKHAVSPKKRDIIKMLRTCIVDLKPFHLDRTGNCRTERDVNGVYRLSAGWPPTLRPSQSTWAVSRVQCSCCVCPVNRHTPRRVETCCDVQRVTCYVIQ